MQIDVKLGDYQTNLAKVRSSLTRLNPTAGTLIVLPELWSSGFDYDNISAQAARSPEQLNSLSRLAAEYNIIIAGSLLEEADGVYFNTLFISDANGILGKYRKQHLFQPMAEDSHINPGLNPAPISTDYGMIANLICYDLRFPEIASLQVEQGAGCIIVAAQWPKSRLEHWRILLQARAIENQAFVIACNRCGKTEGCNFAGHSMIIAPDGSILQEADTSETSFWVDLDGNILTDVRDKFNTIAPSPYKFSARNKIFSRAKLKEKMEIIRGVGKKIVFTNGCFDILHQGHTTYLAEARRQGDCLVVGLNSDTSIRAIKGPERPINSEDSRAIVLAALACVDYVIIFGEETPLDLINTIMPDILVKGADWPVDKIIGAKEVMARGGQVINIPTVAGFSTTNVIGTIQRKNNG